MEYLITSFQVVMPLLILMAVGLLLRVSKIASKDAFLVMNRVVYYAGLPCMMFHNITQKTATGDADWSVAAYALGATLVLFVLFWLIAPRFVKDPRRRGAITQASVRSNDSIFSLTVAAMMLGDGNFNLTVFVAALVAVAYNLLSIITLEMNRGGKIRFGSFLRNLATNPVILSVIAAYLFRLTGWTLPAVLDKPITHLSNMVPPLGFLTLGGILTFEGVKANRKALTFIAIMRLIVIPLAVIGGAVALGFRGLRLLTILLIFAAPTAMASYPLANALGSDAELAGEAVAVTTAFSLPTVFLFLTFFGGLL
ncbi:MAG: AEC family transporter [Clostridia bacterium]|nr:AEC family transporter [Clostridia bacterium]MBR2644830.1 AEC family transporter [Clostridia bacterium]